MSGATGIEWTDATWNPVRGCSRISPGCENCYAEVMAARFSAPGAWAHGFALQRPARWTRKVALVPDMLALPLKWKKPQRIFVNSMSDLFHESLSNEAIAAVFGVMAAAPQHTFQVLTKRAERMEAWFRWMSRVVERQAVMHEAVKSFMGYDNPIRPAVNEHRWPLPNVWLGVSVESQQYAEERIPHLLRVPAAVKFLSCEPLLGPLDLDLGRCDGHNRDHVRVDSVVGEICNECAAEDFSGELSYGHWLDPLNEGIGWVIVGGESGAGARPMRLEWARSVVEQCAAVKVPVFVKQLGAAPMVRQCAGVVTPFFFRGAAHDAKGGDPAEWPDDLRVREFPEARR